MPLTVLWIIACFIVQFSLAVHAVNVSSDVFAWVWIGSMWAGWSAAVWISSAIRHLPLRLVELTIVGAWHVFWMATSRNEIPLRYVLMLGGYAVVQTILFRMLAVPDWSGKPLRLSRFTASKRQFTIAELLVLTTATALLAVSAKTYQDAVGLQFWIGIPWVFFVFAMNAVCCVWAITKPTRRLRSAYAVALLCVIAAGSFSIAWLEGSLAVPARPYLFWWPYFVLQSMFAINWTLLAACGWLDSHRDSIQPPEEGGLGVN